MSEYDELKTWLRNFKPADAPWSTADFTPSNIRDAADVIEALEKERDDYKRGMAISDGMMSSAMSRAEKLEAENKRLREALHEAITDNVWDAYHTGIERDGKWMDGCLSSAEWITRELDLGPGWHNAEDVKAQFPALIDTLVERAALEGKDEQ